MISFPSYPTEGNDPVDLLQSMYAFMILQQSSQKGLGGWITNVSHRPLNYDSGKNEISSAHSAWQIRHEICAEGCFLDDVLI